MRRLLALLAIFAVVACSSPTDEEDAAARAEREQKATIRQLIAEYERGGEGRRRDIEKVEYDGKAAYLIESPCCDMFDYLYDANGNILCAPSGGFAGGGDGRCVHALLEWKDRGPARPARAASAASG